MIPRRPPRDRRGLVLARVRPLVLPVAPALVLAAAGPGVGAATGLRVQEPREIQDRDGPAAAGVPESPPAALRVISEPGRALVRLESGDPLGPASLLRAAGRLAVSLPEADLREIAGRWDPGAPEVPAVVVEEDPAGGWTLSLEVADGIVCDLARAAEGLEITCTPAAAPEPAPDPDSEATGDDPGPGDRGGDPEGFGEAPESGGVLSGRDAAAEPSDADLFRGAPVTLDLRDADLRDVLRLLSEVSGLDFVLQPGVSGRVSLRLTETPWDQALEVVLRSHGLDYLLQGGVLRVGALSELVEEQVERRRQEEARSLAGELETLRHRLVYARPDDLREPLESRLSERGTLIADPRTGTLIVTDVAGRVEEIGEVLEALDVPVPGIEIEARIVLATRTLTRQLGIQWGGGLVRPHTGKKYPSSLRIGADALGAGDASSFRGSGSGGGLTPPAGESGNRPGYGVNLPISGAPTGALGIAMGALGGNAHLDLALMAAEKKGDVRILSAPRIVAQNARPATIKQGVTFPVQVVANNTVTVQFQEAVLELTVTPWVSLDGTVLLDLAINNDQLDFGQAVGGIPSIITQQATTRIRIEDAATAVLGGVFGSQESNDRRRVPGLHRIPLLGHLFRSLEKTSRDEELLIFLTPRIRDSPLRAPPEIR